MRRRSTWFAIYAKRSRDKSMGVPLRRTISWPRKKVNNILNLSIKHKNKKSKKYGYLM